MTMSDSASGPAEPTGRRQVVVTGIGLVTPFGAGREISWSAIRAGRSAVRWFEPEDFSGLRALRWVGASAPAELLTSAEPVVAMALAAAREALIHAGLSDMTERGNTPTAMTTSAANPIASDAALRPLGLNSIVDD